MVTSLPTTEFSFDGSNLPIETVTVYRPSGAQVIRKLDVDLKVSSANEIGWSSIRVLDRIFNHIYMTQIGNNVIEVTNLSSTTETESFRVDGLGNVRLLVVQCTLDRRPAIPKLDPIRDLNSQLEELRAEKGAREQEVAILRAFGKSMPQQPHLTPDQASTFSDTLFDKIIAGAETVRDLDEKIARLNQKINKIRTSKAGAAHTKATITILAEEDAPAQLRLIYRECHGAELKHTITHSLHAGVLNARWDPLYDLYATSEDGKPCTSVSLHYRINLWQTTGEDWTNAKLILSTSATDVLNAGIPRPDNLIIKPPTPPPLMPNVTGSLRYSSCRRRSASLLEEELEEASDEDMGFGPLDCEGDAPLASFIAPLPRLAQSAAAILKSPMAVSYTVDALTTIPSDGVSYKVLVAIVPFEAVITHITTPRRSPIAYLQVWKMVLLGVMI